VKDPDSAAAAKRQAEEIAAVVAATRVLVRRRSVDPRRLGRLARALVRAAESNDPAFLGLTALAEAHRDRASRTAHLALLCLAAAREVTDARRALTRLALTVLVAELGSPPDAREAQERHDEARRAPGAAAAAVIGALGARPGTLRVAAATFEAAWLRREPTLGPLGDADVEPQVAARLIHAAGALLDRIAPSDGSPARSLLDALLEVGALRSVDPAAYRCLVRALGSAPAGMVVELSTGEWAVVLPPSQAEDPLDRPRVRLLTDAEGHARASTVEVDLADPASHGTRVARVVDPAAASAYVAAAFLG
jgi:hypothetical protein